MIKRTFVLFLCFARILAFTLLSWQSVASYDSTNEIAGFSPYTILSDSVDDNASEDICQDNIPIIRTDGCKWKENLSKLLRHRRTTYRLVSFGYLNITSTNSIIYFKGLIRTLGSISLYKGITVLPGYYSFLHRLCPF